MLFVNPFYRQENGTELQPHMNQVLWFYTGNSCEGDVSNLFGQVKKSYVYCSDIDL